MIPVVVLTGFLGAGKTTALNALMAAEPGRRIGVIENEVGEASVDRDLLRGAARVVDVVGGCACCTVRGALGGALEILAERSSELDAIVVEASGVADPVPIVQALQVPAARHAMALSALVCVVDAAAIAGTPLLPHVWMRQLRFAGHVVLTKEELVAEHEVAGVRRRIREHAPDAPIVARLAEVGELFDLPRTAVRPSPEEVADPGHGFSAHALRAPEPVDAGAFDLWVSRTLVTPGVARLKGSVAVHGLGGSYIVNATPQQVEAYRDAGGRGRGRLVVIGVELDRVELQRGLDRCAAPSGVLT